MPEDWFEWVGRTIADDIPLLDYLGGTGDSPLFSTPVVDRGGVVRLLLMDPARAKERLVAFRQAEKLSHPHLLRVFRAGKCEVDGEHLVYVVTEYAEENVGQVLPDRALTTEETHELLTATLAALQYLHAQGFVHADLKPSHIMASGEQLKLSIDGVHRIGEPLLRSTTSPYDAPEAKTALTPASDMWSLGVTLGKVLTQKVAESPKAAEKIDPPFRDIVTRCLAQDPQQRPSIVDVYNILEGKFVASPQQAAEQQSVQAELEDLEAEPVAKPARTRTKRKSKRSYRIPLLAVGALVLVVAIIFGISHRQDNEPARASENQTPAVVTPAPSNTRPVPIAKAPVTPEPESKPPSVTKQVIPDVSAEARSTISGTVRIGVKVTVDPKGDVVDSDLVSIGPSRYFDNLATQAAREWKFSPSRQSSSWELQFNFSRTGTTATSTLINR